MREHAVNAKKLAYGERLRGLLDEYKCCLIVGVNNVSSRQMAQIRVALRGKGVVLMGKNTMIRKIIRDYVEKTGRIQLRALSEQVSGNVGFIFTKESITDIRDVVLENRVSAPAKAGALAPVDVFVPPGPTGMQPTETAFFQSMNIATRINRGQVDIVSQVHLIKKGEKVGPSEASLLSKLDIKPFFYGMSVVSVYDNGSAYSADVLDITDNMISSAFMGGLGQVAALSLALDYPTIVAVPHSVLNAYKETLALGLKFEKYTWEKLDKVKEILENPDAFIAASAPEASGTNAEDKKEEEVKKEEEEESSSSSGGGAGLFGDDDDDSDSD